MGHRNLSYRIWKHLNKRMIRYSQTRKKRMFDSIRYRMWKYQAVLAGFQPVWDVLTGYVGKGIR